ncbi:MAG: SUF system Fe-S cluster assembly regulator [Rhodospirillaceae bacterium]|nr:SUF system Fe-S cluster assembly regulator [Rhodospirillaceae bacterium]MBT5240079.1 SUF system Fe-S cluster assembly regulator [Rhodospirillaceae bacterium]MBT5564758.1 SUF system Fe-S cluster assembly regulator [Rhodospirillaceae bacterium]MBT6088766.1 SUF system Fe-S cluster assembly regulator [Rhodospirillaceae bacterium]
MFKVNKLTDYATVVLIDMASSGLIRPTQAISDNTGIPLPTVAKLMKHLVKSGLVVSHRGVRGGYSLSRPADQTTVADVIEAVEGPIALTACVDTSDEQCSYESLCPASGKWNRVNRAVTGALRDVTLAEMMTDLHGAGQVPPTERSRSTSDAQTLQSEQVS